MSRGARHSFFRVIGYRTNLASARNALAYAAFRSEAVKDKSALIFDARTDSADVNAFQQRLEDRVTANPKSAKAFHALFSLPREAYEQAGVNWPEVVREVFRDYELQTRRKLTWIAVQHDDPKHPHVHVVIKATYQDPSGRTRKLFLRQGELQRIKASLGKSLEARGLSPEPQAPVRQIGRQVSSRWDSAVTAGLSMIQEQLKAERRRRQLEQEEAQRRWERDHDEDRGR